MSAVLPYPTSSSSEVDSTHASMDDTPETRYQSDTATFDSFQSASNCIDFLDDLSNWDLGCYSSHELPSFTLSTPDSQTTPSRTANNSRDMERASKNQEETHQRHSKATPARQQPGNQPKALVEQLAGLNISLFRSARHIASPDSPPLTVLSPHVEGLFEATILVIKIVGTLTPKPSSSKSSPIETFDSDVELQLPNNNDLIFLVLACRQQLLGVFKTVCQSIQRNMGCLAGDVTGPLPGPDGRPSEAQSYTTRDFSVSATLNGGGAPSMAQFTMVMQLLSYLLNRLNHAFDLVGDDLDSLDDGDILQASGQRRHRVRSEQSQEVEMSSEGLGACLLRYQWRSNAPRRGWHGITETAVESIRYQHTSLQQEIEMLQKRIVGSTF
jgi:hypothetical protein